MGVKIDKNINQNNLFEGYKFELGLAERKGFEPSIRY